MKIKELIKQIEIKFAKKDSIDTENIVYDNSGYHLECNDVKEAFKGKKWQDITFEILRNHESSMPFFTDEAFCYFMPIYMIECLRKHEQYDCLLINLVFHLTLPIEIDNQINIYDFEDEAVRAQLKTNLSSIQNNANENIHRFIKRMSGFNADQSQLISYFLTYVEQHMPEYFVDNAPKIANYRYWFKYK